MIFIIIEICISIKVITKQQTDSDYIFLLLKMKRRKFV
jgi:hypothetical protein